MKRPITIISIISIFLFIAALSWFGIGIYSDAKNGSEQNGRDFETLVFKTVNSANTSKIGTPEFSKKFIDAIGNVENYSSLRLDVNGKLIYSYPPSGFSLPSAAITNSFKKTVSTREGRLLTVSASMYAIKANSVYHYAKLAFVLILLGTSISLILLLILNGKKENRVKQEKQGIKIKFFGKKSDKKADKNSELKKDEDEFSFDYADDDSSEIFDDDFFENDFGGNQEETQDENQEKDDDSMTFDFPEENENEPEDESETENMIEDTFTEDEPALPFATDISEGNFEIEDENENLPETKNEEKSDAEETSENENEIETETENEPESSEKLELETSEPEESEAEETEKTESENKAEEPETKDAEKSFLDLNASISPESISPATGLKLQSALLDELDSKIQKSLGESKELTFAILKINGLDRGNSISNKIVEILKSNFKNQDDIYEYNSDGYAIILENKDLSSCADIFDKIYEKMTSYLRNSNSTNEVVVGLSSVNGRKVDAQRLEAEADQALAHALEDPDSPIIAFRANPEKYREYLDNQKN